MWQFVLLKVICGLQTCSTAIPPDPDFDPSIFLPGINGPR
jgi:hypothetical protein